MAKEESKPGGLLSKMVRFVRHPTKNWSELDDLDEDQESQYSKQALKEMIERKRRNDFVRKREFDQLRKLRQAHEQQGAVVASLPALGSQFANSLLSSTASDGRAVTLKKIDEIEAQMSQQWWRGKQAADATTMPMGFVPGGNPMPSAFRKPPEGPVPLLSDVLPAESAEADAGGFMPTMPMSVPPLAPVGADTQSPPLKPMRGDTDFLPAFAATEVSAPAARNLVPPSFLPFEHDPELEEASIVFANGDASGAEKLLQDLIQGREGSAQLALWRALLDLYRAAGWQSAFDKAGIEFASRFGRSAPQWFTLNDSRQAAAGGDMLSSLVWPAGHAQALEATAMAGGPASTAQGWRWQAPAQLTLQALAVLQAGQGHAAAPWTLDFSHITGIDPGVAPPLEALLQQWASAEGRWIWVRTEPLLAVLRAQTRSGDAQVDTVWWRLRLALLRMLHQQDDFELAALDYCVTYEVSPPSWEEPRCECLMEGADGVQRSAHANAPEAADSQLQTVIGGDAPTYHLAGAIEGDAQPWLAPVQERARLGEPVVIDCTHLVRVDFAAAGSVLNWCAQMQGLGHVLQFSHLHQLLAVFFNVIGIQEHAQVLPRQD